MNKFLFEVIEQKIKNLKDIGFQNFVDKLYGLCYDKDFIPIKQKRDKGCDGILKNQIILAVYGPEKYSLGNFKRKIGGDFKNYSKNWALKYHGWQVVFNGEFTAEMVNFVKRLKNDAKIIGIQQIMKLTEKMTWTKIRELVEYLGIDEEYWINDILQEILDDLVKQKASKAGVSDYSKPLYIEEKIKLNYSREDVDTAKNEYEECLEDFSKLGSLFKGYDDEELKTLKSKILIDFQRYNGSFKERLNHLTEEYSRKYSHDDLYRRYVRIVLIYFFEQCLIGKKTEEEKDDNSSS